LQPEKFSNMKNVNSLSELIDLTLSESNESVKFGLGGVSQEFVSLVKELTGMSIEGFEHIVDNYAIRHCIKKHGSAKDEAARGQIAVTINDFKLIPQIIELPDSIDYAGVNNQGNHVLIYSKVIENQLILYLEEMRGKRKEATMQTMYKRKAPTKK